MEAASACLEDLELASTVDEGASTVDEGASTSVEVEGAAMMKLHLSGMNTSVGFYGHIEADLSLFLKCYQSQDGITMTLDNCKAKFVQSTSHISGGPSCQIYTVALFEHFFLKVLFNINFLCFLMTFG